MYIEKRLFNYSNYSTLNYTDKWDTLSMKSPAPNAIPSLQIGLNYKLDRDTLFAIKRYKMTLKC